VVLGLITPGWRTSTVVRLRFLGATPEATIVGQNRLPGVVNYYPGPNRARWRNGIPTYARVRYHSLYPGVDAVFYGDARELEHDFVVAPWGDPAAIEVRAEGIDSLSLDSAGDLVLVTGDTRMRLRKPLIYQEVAGARRVIEGGYALRGDRQYGFRVAAYDLTRPLVIDPVLDYSSYFGGDGADYGRAVAVDSDGNVYLTGATNSTDFPTVNAAQPTFGGGGVDCPSDLRTRVCFDAFVTKINAAGDAILYSTYLGNPGDDEGRASRGPGRHYRPDLLPGEPPLQDLHLQIHLIAKLGLRAI
jgi:hypothetical protein